MAARAPKAVETKAGAASACGAEKVPWGARTAACTTAVPSASWRSSARTAWPPDARSSAIVALSATADVGGRGEARGRGARRDTRLRARGLHVEGARSQPCHDRLAVGSRDELRRVDATGLRGWSGGRTRRAAASPCAGPSDRKRGSRSASRPRRTARGVGADPRRVAELAERVDGAEGAAGRDAPLQAVAPRRGAPAPDHRDPSAAGLHREVGIGDSADVPTLTAAAHAPARQTLR